MISIWMLGLGIVLTAFLVAFAAFLAVVFLNFGKAKEVDPLLEIPGASSVFLFKDKDLIDATPSAKLLLSSASHGKEAWDQMLARLAPLFPQLSQALTDISEKGREILASGAGITPEIVLNIEWLSGVLRLSILAADSETKSSLLDVGAEVALHQELLGLRQAMIDAPMPIWREDENGQVVWANGPYLTLLLERLPEGQLLPWPLPPLFDPLGEKTRTQLTGVDGKQYYYELIVQPSVNEGERLIYAIPCDRLVQLERSLKDFTQTMSKTFAQLPTAVAIFDANRLLQIFNPAFADLTGLPVSFLVGRPTFFMMLDALRERRMIPEPKDYPAWRRQFSEMDGASLTGVYFESWSLPSGQTFRVTGMPQATGALAFLIEDVTNEISNMRRMRADLAMGQSVIDALEEAVVVLSRSGEVALSNRAAKALWSSVDITTEGGGNLLNYWRSLTAPSLIWEDVQQFIGTFGPRSSFTREVQLLDGRGFELQVSAVYGGASMVKFVQLRGRPSLGQQEQEYA